ncbi:MAG: hypothetical protein HQK87_05795 [Nitrospinae bacterium]|nr:hypothetical protein [Nitrospinota bacterium]
MRNVIRRLVGGALVALFSLTPACTQQPAAPVVQKPEKKILRVGMVRSAIRQQSVEVVKDGIKRLIPAGVGFTAVFSTLLLKQRAKSLAGLPEVPAHYLPGDPFESFEISEDEREIIFTLKEGALFSDGTPVTPADIKRSFDEMAEHVGFYRTYYEKVEVAIIDKRRVKLLANGPHKLMGDTTESVVIYKDGATSKAVEGNMCGFPSSVGTGPYRFLECQGSKTIVLTRNEHYRPTPYFSEVHIDLYESRAAVGVALMRGDVDIIYPAEQYEYASLVLPPALVRKRFLDPCSVVLDFNKNHPLYGDRRVRQGISLLINRRSLMASLPREAVESGGGISLFWWLYAPEERDALIDASFNPEKGYQLLAEAGWRLREGVLEKGGRPFSLVIEAGFDVRRAIEILRMVASQLTDAGFVVDLVYDDYAIPNSRRHVPYQPGDSGVAAQTYCAASLERFRLLFDHLLPGDMGKKYYAAYQSCAREDHQCRSRVIRNMAVGINEEAWVVTLTNQVSDVIYNSQELGVAADAYLQNPWGGEFLYRYPAPHGRTVVGP